MHQASRMPGAFVLYKKYSAIVDYLDRSYP